MYASKQRGKDYTGSIGSKGSRAAPSSKPGDDGDFDETTGSISKRDRNALTAIAGEDGDFGDEDAEVTTGSIAPRPLPTFVPSKTKSISCFATTRPEAARGTQGVLKRLRRSSHRTRTPLCRKLRPQKSTPAQRAYARKAETVARQGRNIQRAIERSDRHPPKKTAKAMQAGARRYPAPPFPKQHLSKPGSESDLRLAPMFDAPHYKGSDKLIDKVALITGAIPGSARRRRVVPREGARRRGGLSKRT